MSTILLDNVAVVGAGPVINGKSVSDFSAQASVIGAGAVSATVVIEGSNNLVDWVLIATFNLSGTTRAADGGVATTLWRNIRGRIAAISGTGATASLAMESRGPFYGA